MPRRQAGAGVVPVRTVLIGRPNCVAKASRVSPRRQTNSNATEKYSVRCWRSSNSPRASP